MLLSITCTVNGIEIAVRTATKLTRVDENGDTVDVVEADFRGKTIDVRGVVDYFDLEDTGNGTYQIMVYTFDDIVIH